MLSVYRIPRELTSKLREVWIRTEREHGICHLPEILREFYYTTYRSKLSDMLYTLICNPDMTGETITMYMDLSEPMSMLSDYIDVSLEELVECVNDSPLAANVVDYYNDLKGDGTEDEGLWLDVMSGTIATIFPGYEDISDIMSSFRDWVDDTHELDVETIADGCVSIRASLSTLVLDPDCMLVD